MIIRRLVVAALAAVVSARRGPRAGQRLSVAADPADRAVRGRRRHRHAVAHLRPGPVGAIEGHGRGRECRRRRRLDRHRPGGEGGGRRLYAGHRDALDRDQPAHPEERALQRAARLRAGGADQHQPGGARGQQGLPGQIGCRPDCAGAREAGRHQLRFGRHRLVQLPRHRTVQGDGRRRPHPHSLSRHRPGADRPDRRPHPGGVRERARRARPDQERRAQGDRGGHRQALGDPARAADHCRHRARLRVRARGSACSRPPRRRGR